jgi:hypothetical protein
VAPLSDDATERIKKMKERELIDFISETIVVLENVVDRLEAYVKESGDDIEPGFKVEPRDERHQ